MQARKTALAITATAIASLLAMVLVLNLSLGNKQVDAPLVHLYGVADPQFPRAMASVLNRGLLDGNRIDELLNGDEIFPAMLGAIRAARHTITLETYIYWSGSIGREFSQALSERAKHGVRVHVLLDWIGGQLEDSLLETMRENGVQVRRYNAPHWDNLHRLNNRTHRKLLVVDGQAGFIGGVGIADTWRGNAQDAAHWRDTHFKAQGPVVAQMESAFIDNWLQASPWFATLRSLCDEPQQFDSYMTHVALALATPHVAQRFGNDAGDVLSAAAMPYFTRYFRGTRDQELAADSLAKTVDTQQRMAAGASSVASSDYCTYLDNMIWAFLADDSEGFKAYSAQNLQYELVRLERDLGKVLRPG